MYQLMEFICVTVEPLCHILRHLQEQEWIIKYVIWTAVRFGKLPWTWVLFAYFSSLKQQQYQIP